MKTYFIIVFSMLISAVSMAQWERQHELNFASGFEKNVFLNPETFVTAEGQILGRETMWDNGFYQNIVSQNTINGKWKKGIVKLHMNGGIGVYHTRESANRYHYDVGASYRLRYAERKYIQFSPNINRLKRDGIDVSKAEIRNPFSYHRLELPAHFDFYLRKKWWLKTEIGGIIKAYDRQIPGEKLRYGAPYGELALSKKFKFQDYRIKVSASSRVEHRLFYERSLVSSGVRDYGVETFESGSQAWTYTLHQAEVKWYSPKNRISSYFSPERLSRVDRDVKLSYHQWGIKVGASFQWSKLSVEINAAHRARNYPNLSPGLGNNESLRYVYHTGNAKVKYQLKNKMQVSLNASTVERDSNNPSETMIGFRGYETGMLELGFSMGF